MAKIKMGSMVVDISGKLGGHVYAKNKGGNYVRTKATPLNPQSTAQMAIRGQFASISSRWSELTDPQRESFNGFVSSYATTDIFGDIRNPSGKALFQKLNQNLVNSGQAQIDVCVAPSNVSFANVIGASVNVANETFLVDSQGDTTGQRILFFATKPVSAGTKFVKNDMRVIGVVNGQVGQAIDIWAEYTAKYGNITLGSNIFLGTRVINANGQASPLETIKVDIA